MYWNILDDNRIAVLKKLTEAELLPDFYLAGGTALSLQMGLRESFDFDFFVPAPFNPDDLYSRIQALGFENVQVNNICRGTCDLKIEGIQVSYFHYEPGLLRPYVTDEKIPGLNMASIEDIAAMKAIAIGSRGSKKDFFDLYNIFQRTDFTMRNLVDGLYQKFGENHDFSYVGMGLDYFEDAEQETLPAVFVKYDWKGIKRFFTEEQREFFDEIQRREINLDKVFGTKLDVKPYDPEWTPPEEPELPAAAGEPEPVTFLDELEDDLEL